MHSTKNSTTQQLNNWRWSLYIMMIPQHLRQEPFSDFLYSEIKKTGNYARKSYVAM